MKNCNSPENQTTRRILLIACATALAVAFTVSLPQPAHADHVTPPPVPANIQVPAGNKAFLVGHAVGTQNYICLPSGLLASPVPSSRRRPPCSTTTISKSSPTSSAPTRMRTARFAPRGSTRGTRAPSGPRWHPMEPPPTPTSSRRMRFPGSCLRWLEPKDGPTGGDKLTATTFIQRLNTSGGVAPSTGCDSFADVGKQAFVPYTADYFFYKKAAKKVPPDDDGFHFRPLDPNSP